jgi:hypothetical protein
VARLRQLFNRRTYPGWALLILWGLDRAWWAFGVWARTEFLAKKLSAFWPLLGGAWTVVSPHLTVQNLLLVAGVLWIGWGVRRSKPENTAAQPHRVGAEPVTAAPESKASTTAGVAGLTTAAASAPRVTYADVIPLLQRASEHAQAIAGSYDRQLVGRWIAETKALILEAFGQEEDRFSREESLSVLQNPLDWLSQRHDKLANLISRAKFEKVREDFDPNKWGK